MEHTSLTYVKGRNILVFTYVLGYYETVQSFNKSKGRELSTLPVHRALAIVRLSMLLPKNFHDSIG